MHIIYYLLRCFILQRQYKQKKRIDSLLWKLDKCDIEIISYNNSNSNEIQFYLDENGRPVLHQNDEVCRLQCTLPFLSLLKNLHAIVNGDYFYRV